MSVVKLLIPRYNINNKRRFVYYPKGEIAMDMTANRTVNHSLDNNVQDVLDMLDEAVDEYERGEFISEEELFKELECIK